MNSEKALRIEAAKLNPYHSVSKVCLEKADERCYVGVKNVKQIPLSLIKKLEKTGNYVLHTLDASSLGGRAVDILIPHPVTGKPMTGSSSGTAVNVFTHLNDLGIGTDGGGSVLAPAMSCNLYGFISPLIEAENRKKFEKKSTDGVTFSPSIGFMTREWELLLETVKVCIELEEPKESAKVVTDTEDTFQYPFMTEKRAFPDRFGSRAPLIDFLERTLKECGFLISYEGPVDVLGMGDTIFGHYDEVCGELQRASGKGFLRVANMVNATAVCIPDKPLGRGWVLICESRPEKIANMLKMAEKLPQYSDELITRYFGNLEMYFPDGFGGIE